MKKPYSWRRRPLFRKPVLALPIRRTPEQARRRKEHRVDHALERQRVRDRAALKLRSAP